MSRRSQSCPFENSGQRSPLPLTDGHLTDDLLIFLIVSIPDFQKNVWPNISVSLAKGRINDYGTMLWWNLSAPCRLSGEVWLSQEHGIRQQLSNGTWRQNKEGMWVRLPIPNCIAFIKLCLFPEYDNVKEEEYVN